MSKLLNSYADELIDFILKQHKSKEDGKTEIPSLDFLLQQNQMSFHYIFISLRFVLHYRAQSPLALLKIYILIIEQNIYS